MGFRIRVLRPALGWMRLSGAYALLMDRLMIGRLFSLVRSGFELTELRQNFSPHDRLELYSISLTLGHCNPKRRMRDVLLNRELGTKLRGHSVYVPKL